MPEQVQDFYPTPSTRSTCMYYTGIDPDTLKPVFVPKERADKQLQRALLQYRLPKNKDLVNKVYALSSLEKKVEKAPERKNTRDFGAKAFIRGTEVYKKGLSSGKKGGKNKR
jgi:radical SAM superfamily enzyme YgiQ (UPF0313 family)